MSKKMFALLSAVVVVGVTSVIALVPGVFSGGSGHAGLYRDFDNSDDLVGKSHQIVIARYVGQDTHKIDLVNTEDRAVLGDITLTVRQFQVFEALKGTAQADDVIYVGHETSESFNFLGGINRIQDIEDFSLSEGVKYAIFLREADTPSTLVSTYGAILWAYNGEPSIATVQADSGALQFMATDRYRETWDVLPNSDAPFELTKQDIVDLVN